MADLGFLRGGGANSPGGGRQHMILSNFLKNCMKLKEFGPRGVCASLTSPLDPPLVFHRTSTQDWTDCQNSMFVKCLNSNQETKWVCLPIILQFFCQKLHENEIIWTGGAYVHGASLGSDKQAAKAYSKNKTFKWFGENTVQYQNQNHFGSK